MFSFFRRNPRTPVTAPLDLDAVAADIAEARAAQEFARQQRSQSIAPLVGFLEMRRQGNGFGDELQVTFRPRWADSAPHPQTRPHD